MGYNKYRYCILILALAFLGFSCGTSNSGIKEIDKFQQFSYDFGYPHFSINSHGFYEGKKPKASVIVELIPSSLINYSDSSISIDGKRKATYEISYEIVNSQTSKSQKVIRDQFSGEFFLNEGESPHQLNNIFVTKRFNLERPGVYTVHVGVKDEKTEKKLIKSATVSVPEYKKSELEATDITLFAKQTDSENENYKQITTYNVSGKNNLRFETQILSEQRIDSMKIEVRVLKFLSDTLPARKINAPQFAVSSLEQKGIDYTEEEVIYRNERVISKPDGVFDYEVEFSVREKGNYRFILDIKDMESGEAVTRGLNFGVKRKGYPFLQTPRDLAESLYYLLDEEDYKELLSISDPDSLKKAIDRFWLSNIGNEQKAKYIIDLYYSRVEEANKYFSTYKAGWKTDRGMIYILYGRPLFTSKFYDYIRWAYDTDQYDSRTTFYFDRKRIKSDKFPFRVYILDRMGENSWNKQYEIIQKWLNGTIL